MCPGWLRYPDKTWSRREVVPLSPGVGSLVRRTFLDSQIGKIAPCYTGTWPEVTVLSEPRCGALAWSCWPCRTPLLTPGILVAGTRDQCDQAVNADKGDCSFHSDNSMSSICVVSALEDAYMNQTHRWAIVSKPISSLTRGLPCGEGMAIGVKLMNARLYIERLVDFSINKPCVNHQSLLACTRETTGKSRGPEGDVACAGLYSFRDQRTSWLTISSHCATSCIQRTCSRRMGPPVE